MARVGGTGVVGCFEAVSRGGAVRVMVGSDGRSLGVGLSTTASAVSAAELAAAIVFLNTLAYMRFQLASQAGATGAGPVRLEEEVAAYTRFVAAACASEARRRSGGASAAAARTTAPPVSLGDSALCGRVEARLQRVRVLLEAVGTAWGGVEVASAGGDVVVSVDGTGRLVSLWLAPGCVTGYSSAELEQLINSVLGAAVREAVGHTAIPA